MLQISNKGDNTSMRSKQALLNIISNIASKLVTLIFGIIIPKLYINYFGSEINGLLSSLTGIFVYINLLEAGVGGASIQALYAPISEKNQDKINGILSATQKYYKRSGIYFLACVSILTFIYPIMVKSEIGYTKIALLVLLSSMSAALSYFFQGKYTVLLNADNRGYILTLFNMIFTIVSSTIKIILILLGFSIITVQIFFSVINIMQVIAVTIYVRKWYPKLNLSVQPDLDAIAQKNSVIVHQIAGVIFSNTDVLLLTIFCDLKVVSVYTIYNMIFSQAGYLPTIFISSLTTGFGQLYFENKTKLKIVFNYFEVYYVTLVFIVFVVAYILVLPFLELYMAGVTDVNYINYKLPVLFLAVNILSAARMPSATLINIAGHFKQTSGRAALEMIINLIASIILVNIIGMYGVLLGTIVALLYRTFDIIIYSSRYLLQRSSFIPIGRLMLNTIIGMVIILIYQKLNIEIYSYYQFIKIGFVIFAITSIVYLGLTTLIEKQSRIVIFEYVNILFHRLLSNKS